MNVASVAGLGGGPGMSIDNTAKGAGVNLTRRLVPMGRAAEPADVADVIAFLAGPDALFVTGVVLPVDGGLRACSGQPPHR